MALIEVRNLEKTYFDTEVETRALRGVSFDIDKGEFVAVMGPSGSGKSTLLHILGLLDSYTKGQFRFEGKNVGDYTPVELAHFRNQKFGFVFQMFNLLPRTTVLENIKLPLFYSEVKKSEWDSRAKKAAEEVGISYRLDYQPSQLSGGEKQRVAIARALVNNPEVIFADEPTGNLDSKSGGQVMEVIESLHGKGHTIILVTHETYTANYAQRIIALKDGLIESDRKVSNRLHIHKDHFVK